MTLAVYTYLDQHNIPYKKRSFPETTEKGAAQVAQALGFRARQMVKTLIFTTAKGEHVLVMVGGDQSAKSGLLKKAIGSRNIKMASPAVVQEISGYVVGSIPPFHWQPAGFRSFIEVSLLDETELGVGTGQWGREIIIAPHDLVKAAGATVVQLVP